MASNPGKHFEEQFRKSVPEDVMYYRIPDQAQSFEKTAKFSIKNPCDCMLYSAPLLLPLEMKSTKEKYITVEISKNDKGKMIHWHQIQGLLDFSQYKGIVPGFILNFRIEENNTKENKDLTYFIHINDFIRMMKELGKKSFTLLDLMNYSPIRIKSEKKRVNFMYDVNSFLSEIKNKYENKLN